MRALRAAGCGPGAKVFDYGCSWGYGSGQFRAAGMDVTGYEISPVNRRFAREVIGLNMVDDFEAYARGISAPSYDVFFSSHVLEHLPEVTPLFELAARLVRPGGLFVFFVPNGSEAFMRSNLKRWRRPWGEVHPLFLTDRFFLKAFNEPILLGASPVSAESIATFAAKRETHIASLDGEELTCMVHRP